MKYIMDNKVCLLDSKELIVKALPKYIVLDKYVYEKDEIAVIEDEKSVEYFKNRDDILDFEELFCLSKDDFEYKLNKVTKELNKVCERLLDYPVKERNKLFRDKEFTKKYDTLNKLNEDMIEYKNNKDEIDHRFLSAIHNYEAKKEEEKVKKKSKKK